MQQKPIDVQIDGNTLSFSGYLIKVSEIIGISPLFRKEIDSLTFQINFTIYTKANEITVKYGIERIQPDSDIQRDYDRVRSEYFKVVSAIETILK